MGSSGAKKIHEFACACEPREGVCTSAPLKFCLCQLERRKRSQLYTFYVNPLCKCCWRQSLDETACATSCVSAPSLSLCASVCVWNTFSSLLLDECAKGRRQPHPLLARHPRSPGTRLGTSSSAETILCWSAWWRQPQSLPHLKDNNVKCEFLLRTERLWEYQ